LPDPIWPDIGPNPSAAILCPTIPGDLSVKRRRRKWMDGNGWKGSWPNSPGGGIGQGRLGQFHAFPCLDSMPN
jgi:hypothetical protein